MSPAERALAAVGARFRLHGRTPDDGLDCVGLVAWAHGWTDVPTGYGLRSGGADRIAAWLDARLERGEAGGGDVLLMRTGPGQLHLGIATARGLVHADAGLRRVCVRPGAVPWPVLDRWRG